MSARVPQYALDFTGRLPHPAVDMRKCIFCKKPVEAFHGANQTKQLTCGKHLCQRALKTIRQSLRRDMVKTKQKRNPDLLKAIAERRKGKE